MLLVVIVVGAVGGLVVYLLTRPVGVDRVAASLRNHSDCATVHVQRPLIDHDLLAGIQRASSSAAIVCDYLGGQIDYLEFRDRKAPERVALVAPRPHLVKCVVGSDVLVDELLGYGFDAVCADLGGTRLSS